MILGKNFSNLKVILVEPNGPLNVGSVARLCSNFEVDELRIVSPKCDIFSLEAKKMALKGQKFLKHCKVFDNIQNAIFDWTLSFKKINNLAIIFGREDRGLTNSELLLANKTFNIPTSQDNPSLNLSHAVSIVLYELNKSSKKNLNNELKVFNLASSNEVHDTFVELEEMLLRVGYLLEHTSKAKISKFKNFILRANTSMHEINVLRGIVHQISWFLNNSKKNK